VRYRKMYEQHLPTQPQLTPEERMAMQTRLEQEQMSIAQQNQILNEQQTSMVKEQLDLRPELERIEHLLRGETQSVNEKGELTWHKPEDEDLIAKIAEVNNNCIVVLEGGSAIITEAWKDKVKGIIVAWYPGMEGGTALGEIIFGDINPCGKLPMVFPKSQEQLPFIDIKAREIEYNYYHGYNLMDKEGYEPAFPFGFGLSYTTYSYDNLKIDKTSLKENEELKVSVEVTNTGKVAGEEIVQLYVGYKGSSVERHVKDLKGFGKISLKPDETKTITIELKAKDLAYYDVKKKDWVVEKIEYLVHVGPSSQANKLLTTSFKFEKKKI